VCATLAPDYEPLGVREALRLMQDTAGSAAPETKRRTRPAAPPRRTT
jgi:hypothetical protein